MFAGVSCDSSECVSEIPEHGRGVKPPNKRFVEELLGLVALLFHESSVSLAHPQVNVNAPKAN
jgi:hypothetical protein